VYQAGLKELTELQNQMKKAKIPFSKDTFGRARRTLRAFEPALKNVLTPHVISEGFFATGLVTPFNEETRSNKPDCKRICLSLPGFRALNAMQAQHTINVCMNFETDTRPLHKINEKMMEDLGIPTTPAVIARELSSRLKSKDDLTPTHGRARIITAKAHDEENERAKAVQIADKKRKEAAAATRELNSKRKAAKQEANGPFDEAYARAQSNTDNYLVTNAPKTIKKKELNFCLRCGVGWDECVEQGCHQLYKDLDKALKIKALGWKKCMSGCKRSMCISCLKEDYRFFQRHEPRCKQLHAPKVNKSKSKTKQGKSRKR
jgi:hypothetical protein